MTSQWWDRVDMEIISCMQLRMELITEYSFFAPAEVNEQIKSLRKGERFEITKAC